MAESPNAQDSLANALAGPPTNGQLVVVVGTPGRTYWVDNNQLRWIPDTQTYNNIFLPNASVNTISQLYNQGPNLPSGSYLAANRPDLAVYLIEKNYNGSGRDMKRHIANPQSFSIGQFNDQVIVDVTYTYINNCVPGPDISY